MGIWRVEKASVRCDGCQQFIGILEGPVNCIDHLERVRVTCVDCGAQELVESLASVSDDDELP